MKITIESTPELAHANGLPVRVWTGTAERGTSLLVLVTRIAAPDDGHPDDLAELKAALLEPPTRHGVYGETPVVAAPRSCTMCLTRDLQRLATHVARDADGVEWFECAAHDPTDNVAEVVRVDLEPIADWFARHELPLPGGVYSGPAAQREPWASMIARAPSDEWCCSCGAGNDARGYAHLATCMLQRALRAERLAQRAESGPSWLVKDFHALYLAADTASVALLKVPRAAEARTALMMQLARLRPAFDVCESERLGAPDRLTTAERFALTGLHRWLHSPGGDSELVESAEPYHEQVEGESPPECDRLEAEEQRACAGIYEAVARVRRDEREKEKACGVVEPPLPHEVITAIVSDDRAGEQTGSVFVLCAMRGAQMGWHAKHAHPETIALTGRRGAPVDEPARTAWLTGYRLGAGLDPADQLDADKTPEAPKASTPGACRVCGCTDDDCSQCIAKTGEPCAWVEPDLCSACAFDKAVVWDGGPVEASPEPVVLTDELREYVRGRLYYRAPELLTARDRAILAAYEAEETARAKSPETWLGGDR